MAVRLGAYQKAIDAGLQAARVLDVQPRTEEMLTDLSNLYINVGLAYRASGNLEEAQRYFRQGIELTKAFTSTRSRVFWSGVFSFGLGLAAYSQGDYETALQQGEKALQFQESFLAGLPPQQWAELYRRNSRRHIAWDLWLIGRTHLKLGNLAEAEKSLLRGVSISKTEGLEEVQEATTSSLGAVALARKDFARALDHYQGAFRLAKDLNATASLAFIAAGIGQGYAGQARLEEARTSFKQSVQLLEGLRSQFQEAGLRSGFVEDKQEIYHEAVRVALDLANPAEAFAYAERARARAFLDLLGTQTTISKARTRALVQEELGLRGKLAEAQALVQGELAPEGRARARQELQAAEGAYLVFLDRVRKESAEQASLMTVDPVTLPEVQRLLPEGTTLLEYLVTEQETILWVIDQHRLEVVRLPVTRSILVPEARALRQVIETQASATQVEAQARVLYERIVASARPHIRGKNLLIVAHDVLHYLPFGALRTPEGRWLIEDYTITTLPSASVLKFLQDKGAGASNRALAVGNPDVGPALNLRFAEREARAVGERYPMATVLVRQDATEGKAKALSGDAGILHFATHGELNEKEPLSSALLLVPDAKEDGRLEVREIFGLDLNARLVVLSACETGLGKLSKGDELVGLQRAFIYAGTPAVVTTLWKVDDRASFYLMREFYEYLEARGPAEALRQAQRATMADFPHPFFWAAFGLTGVPR